MSIKHSLQEEHLDNIKAGVPLDIGYNNAFWMKISDKKVVGFGEVSNINGALEDVETWIFNEFCKEAVQLNTKVLSFKTESKIYCLSKLKSEIEAQIIQLKENNKDVQKTHFKSNKKTKKSRRLKGIRTPRKNKK